MFQAATKSCALHHSAPLSVSMSDNTYRVNSPTQCVVNAPKPGAGLLRAALLALQTHQASAPPPLPRRRETSAGVGEC